MVKECMVKESLTFWRMNSLSIIVFREPLGRVFFSSPKTDKNIVKNPKEEKKKKLTYCSVMNWKPRQLDRFLSMTWEQVPFHSHWSSSTQAKFLKITNKSMLCFSTIEDNWKIDRYMVRIWYLTWIQETNNDIFPVLRSTSKMTALLQWYPFYFFYEVPWPRCL